MAVNRRLTPEEEDALREKAAKNSIERDVAVNAAARASLNESAAREVARDQSAAARNAENQAAGMNTLRHVASARANQEAQSAETSRFGFYLLLGIVLLAIVLAGVWFATRGLGTKAPGPSTAPTAIVIPGAQGPQGPQGSAGSPAPAAPQGAQGPAGTPGPSGPAGEPGPSGPAGAPSGDVAPNTETPPSGQ